MKHKYLPMDWNLIQLGSVLKKVRRPVDIDPDEEYRQIGIRSHGKGIFHKEPVLGRDLGNKSIFWVRPGDFVLNIVFAWEGAVAVVTDAELGMCGSHRFPTFVVNPDKLELDYLLLYFKSQEGIVQLESVSPGGAGRNKTLSQSDFLRLKIPLPPIDEQRRITKVLRDADAHIAHVEAQIGAAQAVKRGVMQRLFTYGLADEETPTKHTRIGEIPAGWEVVQLGQLLHSIEAGRSPQALDRPAEDDEWGVLRVSAVRPEGLQAHENKAVIDPQHINSAYEIHEGDVLISRANTFELVGLVTFVEDTPPRLMLSDKTLRLVVNRNFSDSRFLSYFLQSEPMRQQIIDNATGTSAGMKNISQDSILRLPVACPDLGEQREIAAILSAHDATIRSLQVEAESLREVKRGLMQKLLSGEVRV